MSFNWHLSACQNNYNKYSVECIHTETSTYLYVNLILIWEFLTSYLKMAAELTDCSTDERPLQLVLQLFLTETFHGDVIFDTIILMHYGPV